MDHIQLFLIGITVISALCFAGCIYLGNLHPPKFIALGVIAIACAIFWPFLLRESFLAHPYTTSAVLALTGFVFFMFIHLFWVRGVQRWVAANADSTPATDDLIDLAIDEAKQNGFKEEFLCEWDKQKNIHGEMGLKYKHLLLALENGGRTHSRKSGQT